MRNFLKLDSDTALAATAGRHNRADEHEDGPISIVNRALAFRYDQTRVVQVEHKALRNRRVLTGVSNDPATTAYKIMRTQLLQKMKERGYKTLGITSVSPGEGKTLTAVNLAAAMSLDENHTVLLVDLDLRKPGVADLLGFEPEFGMADFLKDNVPLSRLFVHPCVGRLVVLPGRGSIEGASEILASSKVGNLVEEFKDRYSNRIVLFDLPSLSEGDDLLAFLPYIEGLLLVIEEGKVKRSQFEELVSMLPPEKVLGTVVNKGGR